MTKSNLHSAITATLLAAAPLALLLAPATAAYAYGDGAGTDATNCLDLVDNGLYNGCGFAVEAAWCVENVDCRGGRYTNIWTIGSGVRYPVQGASTGNHVRWAACKGRNTLDDVGNGSNPYRHQCNSSG